MADITATHIEAGRSTGGFSIFGKIFDFLVKVGESNARVRKLERLSALSDEQLAKMGLERENLVRYVFSDFMYV